MSVRHGKDDKSSRRIEFVVLSKELLRFRKDAFLFILVVLMFFFYIVYWIGFLNLLWLYIILFSLIFFFSVFYFFPRHNYKLRVCFDKYGFTAGIVRYPWKHFTSFFVLKEGNVHYLFLKGFLFDSLFPIVVPVHKKDYNKVFKFVRKHLIYEGEIDL